MLQPRLAQKYADDKTGYQNHVCQKKMSVKNVSWTLELCQKTIESTHLTTMKFDEHAQILAKVK